MALPTVAWRGVPGRGLGRGAAGPSDCVALGRLSPSLSQSRANIVVVMAGRSSATRVPRRQRA